MRNLSLSILPLLSSLIFVGGVEAQPTPTTQSSEVETFEYIVQEGDSCTGIARRVFGDRSRYDIIHQFNPGMGPTPHHLVAGSVLILPRQETTRGSGPDARVTATRRDVQAREPAETEWQRAPSGLGLYSGWRVNTLEDSAASLTFSDTSVIQMRENTLVIIYGGEGTNARRATTTRAELQRGTLRSRLGELRLQVNTPSSQTELDGGMAVVSVDEEGTSRVSNHGGRPAVVRGEAGGSVRVRPGYGAGVQRGARPSRPRRLPDAPTWSTGPRRFGGFASTGGTLVGEWQAIESARLYRVEVRRAGESAILAAAEVPSNILRFEIHRIPAGNYEVRLSTIDREFFESRAGEPEPMQVTLAQLVIPGATPEPPSLPDPSVEVARVVAFEGTELHVPEGTSCALDGGSVQSPLILTPAGEREVRCSIEGQPVAPFVVDVTTLVIDVPTGEDGEAMAVVVGEPQEIRIPIRSEMTVPGEIQWDGEGVALSDVRREGDVWIATVMAETAGEHALVWSLGNSVVGRVAVSAVELETEPEPEPEPEPESEVVTASPIGQQVFSVMRRPSLMGLQESRNVGIQGTLAISHEFSDRRTATQTGSTRFAAVMMADIGDLGRIVLGTQAALGDGLLGDDDFYAGAGLRFAGERWSTYVEMAAWFPTGSGSEQFRLAPSISFGYETSEDFFLRTRQGALLDLRENGRMSWASAYGADLRLYGPLFAGAEMNLSLGSDARGEEAEFFAHLTAGLSIGLSFDTLRLTAAFQRALTESLQQERGEWVVGLAASIGISE